MLVNALHWAWERYRPAEGWLSLFLLWGAVTCLTASIAAVEWVPEIGIVTFNGFLGLLLGIVVAKGPLRPLAAWSLLLGYGLTLTTLYVGQLSPPLLVLLRGQGGAYFRQQWALLLDRVAGWLLAVSAGDVSRETIVFAFALGLVVWLLVVYVAWSTYRRRRPLVGLTLIGFALAVNGYYGGDDAPVWLIAFFIGFSTLLVSALHFANMEHDWSTTGVDYSQEIRLELLAAAGGVALILAFLALILPAIRFSALAEAFQETEPVQQAETMMERAFAGVRQPRREAIAFVGQSAGVMPRAFLLGNPPHLHETVVMTAAAQPYRAAATHWRALSYDVYTGRGWALSQERRELVAPNQPIPLPPARDQLVFTQTVRWLGEEPAARYTLGYPLSFDHQVAAYWRGVDDFSRVSGAPSVYTATSTLTIARPAALRQARLEDVPDALRSRYTQLPARLPQRVRALAQDVAGAQPTPYDQARALEIFLRQYPYSLDVEPPPASADPVDFFLFDLQEGYCDYYASAMVVLARSLGLPARLATGYLAQPPDETGAQTIRQINAHAWAEIYFAGYGWVEFEPTAAFPASGPILPAPEEASPGGPVPDAAFTPPPIPAKTWQRFSPWLALLLILITLGLWFWWLRRPRRGPDGDTILWAYARLLRSARRLGYATPPGQTPTEFQVSFLRQLSRWERWPWLARRLRPVRPAVERLTALFIARQYARRDARPSARGDARHLWQRIARPLWWLALLKKLLKSKD